MATKAEIRQRVGEDLGLVEIGQSLESQDQIRIDNTFDEVYEILKDKAIASWASTDEVPTKCVPYFCLLIEEKLLTSYSVPESRFLRIKKDAGDDGMVALLKLAALATQIYESVDNESDY